MEQLRSSAWPAADEAGTVWRRLRDGAPDAGSDLCVLFLDPLCAWLRSRNRHVDPHLCEQAAGEALLSLLREPVRFDPDRGTLPAYLKMAAAGDLKNLLRRESRRRAHEVALGAVEHALPGGNSKLEAADPADQVVADEAARERRARLPVTVLAGFTAEERAVLDLMLGGERKTEPFAAVLGIGCRPLEQQRREVKRVKDRVKKRLERAGGGHVPPD